MRRLIVLALLSPVLLVAGSASAFPPGDAVACNDTYDNDGDGWIDATDPGCQPPPDIPPTLRDVWREIDNDEYNDPDPDWDFNTSPTGLGNEIGEDDPLPLATATTTADCRNMRLPVVRREYRGSTGFHHWTVFQRVRFCWRDGLITSFERERWIWKTPNPLSGWSWEGWIGTNCNTENCGGRGVGTTTTSAWTQGKWRFCSLKWVFCHEVTPLLGIRVFGNGAVQYFRDTPQ